MIKYEFAKVMAPIAEIVQEHDLISNKQFMNFCKVISHPNTNTIYKDHVILGIFSAEGSTIPKANVAISIKDFKEMAANIDMLK